MNLVTFQLRNKGNQGVRNLAVVQENSIESVYLPNSGQQTVPLTAEKL